MTAALAHAAVLAAPLREWRNERGPWSLALQLALVALPVLGVTALVRRGEPGATLGLALPVLMQLAWMFVFSGLLRQNTPRNARLVPAHVRVLREVTLGLWLAITALSSALHGFSLAWGLGAAALMLQLALMLRMPSLWVPFSVGLSLVNAWFPLLRRAQLVEAWNALSPTTQLTLAAAALLLMGWVLGLLLREGNAAHARQHARLLFWRELGRRGIQGRSQLPAIGGERTWRLTRWFQTPFYRWMDHLLHHAAPTPRSALARLELVLGAHWMQHLAGAAIFLLIAGLCFSLGYSLIGDQVFLIRDKAAIGMTVGAMCATLSPIHGLAASLHASRREQALLMLAPGMPRGAALNQGFARRLMLRALAAWLLGLSLVTLITIGTPAFGPALAFTCACLPATVPTLWRDWSRVGAPTGMSTALPILIMVAMGAAAAGLAYWLKPPAPSLLLLPAMALAWAAWYWRKLARWPQALPAGRLADSPS